MLEPSVLNLEAPTTATRSRSELRYGGIVFGVDPTRSKTTYTIHDDEYSSKLMQSRLRLKNALDESEDNMFPEPTHGAMMGAYDNLVNVDRIASGHDVKTFVASQEDVVTNVTDHKGNYVVFMNRSDGTVAVHFNICSYQEYDTQGDVPQVFVESLLSSLKRPTEPGP